YDFLIWSLAKEPQGGEVEVWAGWTWDDTAPDEQDAWAARGRTTQGSTPMTSRGTACSTARRTLGASTAWTPATWTSYPRWRHRNGPTTALRTGAGATSGWRPAEHEHR